jgi:hypothetical protein
MESQQKANKRDYVERLSKPAPIRPARDSRRELRRRRRIKWNFLKCQRLGNEEQSAPSTHHDIGCRADQQQPAHWLVFLRQERRHEEKDSDGRMNRNPEPLKGHAGTGLDDEK